MVSPMHSYIWFDFQGGVVAHGVVAIEVQVDLLCMASIQLIFPYLHVWYLFVCGVVE